MVIEDYFFINGTYELKDGVYNVKGHVSLIKRVEKLPCKFGKVIGNFYCYGNKLKSLEGAPKSIGGYFSCYTNNLETLEGAPKWVGGDFDCDDNHLNSLEYCPAFVGGDFFCDEELESTKEYRQYLIMKELRK